jgi:DUF4097 and DUF4098 domain-containing protein YvlB
MRLSLSFVVAGLAATVVPAAAQPPLPPEPPRVVVRDAARTAHAYQGHNTGPEQTERFSRKIKLGADGRVSITNISGDISVASGSGDEVSIEAVKRTRGEKSELALVQITVDDRPGRIDVRTESDQNRSDRGRRGNSVSVDYTVTVPASAGVELHSISGTVKVMAVHGAVRAETISGDVTTTDTPRLELAKSVSGDVSFGGVAEGDVIVGSVSGNVSARAVKARGLDIGSVSGNVTLADVACERLMVKSVSGNVGYSGTIAKAGRYEINSHSGNVRLTLANPPGFELTASSFSGSIRSELPLTIGGDSSHTSSATSTDGNGDRRRSSSVNSHNIRATYGDGSATISVRTFSGDVVIAKQ